MSKLLKAFFGLPETTEASYSYMRRLQPTNKQYKVKEMVNGVEIEIDTFKNEFYAKAYATKMNLKLVKTPCDNHLECLSRCCAGTRAAPNTKICQRSDIEVNPLTQMCIDFDESEVSQNIFISIIVAISIVAFFVCLWQFNRLYR